MKGQRFFVLVAGVLVAGWGSLASGTVCCLPDGTCLTDDDGISTRADCEAMPKIRLSMNWYSGPLKLRP